MLRMANVLPSVRRNPPDREGLCKALTGRDSDARTDLQFGHSAQASHYGFASLGQHPTFARNCSAQLNGEGLDCSFESGSRSVELRGDHNRDRRSAARN